MELVEMIQEALIYPSKNLKALGIYILLGVIIGIVIASTGVGAIAASAFTGSSSSINGAGVIVLLIGIIVLIALLCLVDGYGLDIIKLGIMRSEEAPEVDFKRQVSNGIKNIIVTVVYLLIPLIITVILALFLREWLLYILAAILFLIFSFALTMAQCRLAESEELSYALDIMGSINDLSTIGVPKVIVTVIVIAIVSIVISGIITLIFGLLGSQMLTSIVSALVGVYLLFFEYRAIGLLYSEK